MFIGQYKVAILDTRHHNIKGQCKVALLDTQRLERAGSSSCWRASPSGRSGRSSTAGPGDWSPCPRRRALASRSHPRTRPGSGPRSSPWPCRGRPGRRAKRSRWIEAARRWRRLPRRRPCKRSWPITFALVSKPERNWRSGGPGNKLERFVIENKTNQWFDTICGWPGNKLAFCYWKQN